MLKGAIKSIKTIELEGEIVMDKNLPKGFHIGNNYYLVIMNVCTDDFENIWEERQFTVKADKPQEAEEKIRTRISEDESRVCELGVSNYSGIFEIGDTQVINLEKSIISQLVKLNKIHERKK